jgi:separase
MGCSSGALRSLAPAAEFDPTGMVLAYMQAGAPAVVGNLWEVTDRDLDAVCQGTYTATALPIRVLFL